MTVHSRGHPPESVYATSAARIAVQLRSSSDTLRLRQDCQAVATVQKGAATIASVIAGNASTTMGVVHLGQRIFMVQQAAMTSASTHPVARKRGRFTAPPEEPSARGCGGWPRRAAAGGGARGIVRAGGVRSWAPAPVGPHPAGRA